MIIKTKKISELKLVEYNPRKISDTQFERLKKSIEEFDLVEPIVWNKRSQNVVGGHQRLKVLQDLGKDTTEVVVVDLSPSKEKALNLALNKIQGEWDLIKLKEVILEIDTGEFPITLTGFDYDELRDIVDYQREELLPSDKDDEVPEPPEEPVTQLGDIWKLGEHRLLCGDSTNQKDVDLLMGTEKADIIFTDPPYNVNYEDTQGRSIQNDNMKDFRPFLTSFYSAALRAVGKDIPAYVCYAEVNVLDFLTTAIESGWKYRNTLIWLKDVQAMNFGHYTWKYEPILYLVKGAPKFYGVKNHPNVFEIPSFCSFAGRFDDKGNKITRTLHPNQKPVELIVRLIMNSSKENEIVLDPFGGSGSTMIACEKTKRKARLIELDPIYCDVIVKRWETFTGEKGEIINAKEKKED